MMRSIFLSHSWRYEDHAESSWLQDYVKQRGFKLWVDFGQIVSGQAIHDRIAQGLADVHGFLVLITEFSYNRQEVLEEIYRAHERQIPILLLKRRNTNSRLPNCLIRHRTHPFSELQQVSLIEYGEYALDQDMDVQAKIDDWLGLIQRSSVAVQVQQCNYVLYKLGQSIKELARYANTFEKALSDSILKQVEEELEGALATEWRYSANIGSERNYLIRARPLFEAASNIFVVSREGVSRFWDAREISDEVDKYLKAQHKKGSNEYTIRLFVFSTIEEAHRNKSVIERHFSVYGADHMSGAVLISNISTYEAILKRVVTHPQYVSIMMTQDFALLEVKENESTLNIEAVLSQTHFSFRDVSDTKPGIINHNAFKRIMLALARKTGEKGHIKQFDGTGAIILVTADSLKDNEWNRLLSAVFRHTPGRIRHYVWFRNGTHHGDYSSFRHALCSIRRDLVDKLPPTISPARVWFGGVKDNHDHSTMIMQMEFENYEKLLGYYKNSLHSDVRFRLYAALMPSIASLIAEYRKMTKGTESDRHAMFESIEAAISTRLVRKDYQQLQYNVIRSDSAHDATNMMTLDQRPPTRNDTLSVGMSRSWKYFRVALGAITAEVKRKLNSISIDNVKFIIPNEEQPHEYAFLDKCDCLVVLQTHSSMNDLNVHEELVRAHERGITIIPVVGSKKIENIGMQVNSESEGRVPSFLNDVLHLRMEGANFKDDISALTDELALLARSFSAGNYLLTDARVKDMKDILSASRRVRYLAKLSKQFSPFNKNDIVRSDILVDLLRGAKNEILGIVYQEYAADIGADRNYLRRAGPLFRQASNIYAVSIDHVSRFWTDDRLRCEAQRYLTYQLPSKLAHGRQVFRLFVFSTPMSAAQSRSLLDWHYSAYGEANGGVFVCSLNTYFDYLENVFALEPNDVAKLKDMDFGVLDFRSGIPRIEARLTNSSFSFSGALKINHERFIAFLNKLALLRPGEFSNKIFRWRPFYVEIHEEDKHTWTAVLEKIFEGEEFKYYRYIIECETLHDAGEIARMIMGVWKEKYGAEVGRYARVWSGVRLEPGNISDGESGGLLAIGPMAGTRALVSIELDNCDEVPKIIEQLSLGSHAVKVEEIETIADVALCKPVEVNPIPEEWVSIGGEH